MTPLVEAAARHLCRWRGTGMAWHADLEWTAHDDLDNASADRLPVVRRGRMEEGAARSIGGGARVAQQRSWSVTAKAAVMPCHRSASDVGAALAMAKLDGPLEAMLMLVCCEDLARWPEVRRHALHALRHPFAHEAVTDAMHRIMWRRPVLNTADRAKQLGVRKVSYAKIRHYAEDMLGSWSAEAASRFLNALK